MITQPEARLPFETTLAPALIGGGWVSAVDLYRKLAPLISPELAMVRSRRNRKAETIDTGFQAAIQAGRQSILLARLAEYTRKGYLEREGEEMQANYRITDAGRERVAGKITPRKRGVALIDFRRDVEPMFQGHEWISLIEFRVRLRYLVQNRGFSEEEQDYKIWKALRDKCRGQSSGRPQLLQGRTVNGQREFALATPGGPQIRNAVSRFLGPAQIKSLGLRSNDPGHKRVG